MSPLPASGAPSSVERQAVQAVRVRLSEPSLVPDLLDALRRAEQCAETEGNDALRVLPSRARAAGEPHEQDRVELEFFLRSWAAARGDFEVEVEPEQG